MKMYVITFRSVTLAQRGQRLLRSHGMETILQRTPRWMEERGCGYCLRIRPEQTDRATVLLRQGQLPYSRVYTQDVDGEEGRRE